MRLRNSITPHRARNRDRTWRDSVIRNRIPSEYSSRLGRGHHKRGNRSIPRRPRRRRKAASDVTNMILTEDVKGFICPARRSTQETEDKVQSLKRLRPSGREKRRRKTLAIERDTHDGTMVDILHTRNFQVIKEFEDTREEGGGRVQGFTIIKKQMGKVSNNPLIEGNIGLPIRGQRSQSQACIIRWKI